jgi:DNA/RNA-binding domain of Phe-tRNA-synthetase-like protein
MRLRISPEVEAFVAPAILEFDELVVVDRDSRMDAPIAATAARVVAETDLEPTIAAVRAMYRRFGVDPTKTRPSSEALLRRVRKGEGLPRINSLVDICNWCSLETQLPFGLYDRARIEGDEITLRLGAEGEGYEGIRKDRVNVAGRLALADAAGAFGNPTSDSARTMVTTATREALFVVFCPRALESSHGERASTLTAGRVNEFARVR